MIDLLQIARQRPENRKRSHSGEGGMTKTKVPQLQTNQRSARDKAEDMIREAEASRALVLATPGNYQPELNISNQRQGMITQGNVSTSGAYCYATFIHG